MKITKLVYNVAKGDYEEVCFVIPDDKAKEIEREKLDLLIEEILKRNEIENEKNRV